MTENAFNPLISIVIPVYNGSNYMSEAIDSALAQTYANKEIIVINDGSRDDGKTLEIAKSYGDKIRLIDQENGGVASALNAGIENANGDYISWLSHDDAYPEGKLEHQVAFMEKHQGKDIVLYGDLNVIDNNSKVVNSISLAHYNTDDILFNIMCHQYLNGCTFLIPKAVFDDVGLFRKDLPTTQDYDLWLRVAQKYTFVHQPGVVLKSRVHEEQGSRTMAHKEEVHDFYKTHLPLLNIEYMRSHFDVESRKQAYRKLLAKFAHLQFRDCYETVRNQALQDLELNFIEKLKFEGGVALMSLQNNTLSKIKAVMPLWLKNTLRPNLNRKSVLGASKQPNKLDFTKIYEKNGFNCDESISGTGSTLIQTEKIREELPKLFEELSIKSLLDTPCGDFGWLQLLDLGEIEYTGGDIVEDLIAKNQEKFQNDKRTFKMLNIIEDTLPKADVILCRDCLVHMNFEDGLKAVENFKKSGSKYLLTTTFADRKGNEDLYGIWRPLNLEKAPYNFPEPVKLINENCTEADGQFTDKCLGLWRLEDL